MVTNDLKKGDLVQLQNGWMARIADNRKGNVRLATVYGFHTEMGSVYSHDIIELIASNRLKYHAPSTHKYAWLVRY